MTNKEISEDAKDGFDLIEYPCQYVFKAMCRANDNVEQLTGDVVRQILPEKDIIKIHSSFSRTAKFQSVNVTVHLTERSQLEQIYSQLAASDHVVMTL